MLPYHSHAHVLICAHVPATLYARPATRAPHASLRAAHPRQLSPPRRSELVEELRALERALDFELCVDGKRRPARDCVDGKRPCCEPMCNVLGERRAVLGAIDRY